MRKVKFLFTDLLYINHNYGVQGISFPLMKNLDKFFDAQYTFVLPFKYHKENYEISKEYNFKIIEPPIPIMALADCYPFLSFFYFLKKIICKNFSKSKEEKKRYLEFLDKFKEHDVIIDLAGIEFIGNQDLKRKISYYLKTFCFQCLARKYKKLYLKYTKSYGPFSGKIYKYFVKKSLNKLPFVFVRGVNNLKEIKKLNLKVPVYSFPDISIILDPAPKDWVIKFLARLKIDTEKPIVGISPSAVIAGIKKGDDDSLCGEGHINFCKKIIDFFQKENKQVLILPHSVLDGKNIRECDLALSRKIYRELKNKKNVFLIENLDLTYQQAKAIIGNLSFYITGRYHSVASALSMAVPVVSFSWHIKYKDIMSLFLDDFLALDYKINSQEALSLIKEYYLNQKWFNRERVLKRKEKINREINKSISIIVEAINKYFISKK